MNETTLFVPRGRQMLLLSSEGEVVHSEQLETKEFALFARGSADGKRITVPICTKKGGNEILDISRHVVLKRIMVYDLVKQQWVYQLDDSHVGLQYISGFALSPDGSRFAVFRDGGIEVYALPR